MKRVFVYLSLLAMFVMIASPVLGCCGLGHSSATHDMPIKVAATPSCHGPDIKASKNIQYPNTACPSCENCVDQIVDRVDAGTLTLDVTSNDVAIFFLKTTAPTARDWRLPPIAAPPARHDPTPVDSPTAQNDRLLI